MRTASACKQILLTLESERERCGYSNVGTVVTKDDNGSARLILTDRESKEYPVPIDLPMNALFPPGRRQERVIESVKKSLAPFDAAAALTEKYGLSDRIQILAKATELVFSLPSVGSKMFLITIADRVSIPSRTTLDHTNTNIYRPLVA